MTTTHTGNAATRRQIEENVAPSHDDKRDAGSVQDISVKSLGGDPMGDSPNVCLDWKPNGATFDPTDNWWERTMSYIFVQGRKPESRNIISKEVTTNSRGDAGTVRTKGRKEATTHTGNGTTRRQSVKNEALSHDDTRDAGSVSDKSLGGDPVGDSPNVCPG